MFYARDTEEALAMVRSGDFDAAFLMRPTRVEQVRELAAAGENMPPKSTFFFPKLLTGLLFNPLAVAPGISLLGNGISWQRKDKRDRYG